jgi:iron complex transport system substrate-binding protein
MRIASLLASGTEIAWALGLGDDIVAISHECDYPPGVLDRPRITRPRFDPEGLSSGEVDAAVREAMADSGGVYAIDEEALRSLAPDLVLTQAVCEVCAVPASDAQFAVAALGGDVNVLSLDAHTIAGILETIGQVGNASGASDAADKYVAALEARLDRVRSRVAESTRPTVLGLEWLDPPFIPGHWVPEMVDLAGGTNLAGSPGARSNQASWADVSGFDPDVLLIMPCGYSLEAARQDADTYAQSLLSVAPRAVAEGRAFVVDASSYFNRSGPRVVDGVEILAALLHPDLFPDVTLEGRAGRWQPQEDNRV